jgi:hypothetical protein
MENKTCFFTTNQITTDDIPYDNNHHPTKSHENITTENTPFISENTMIIP